MRTYAIGDTHGQLDMLRAAHGRIAEDRARTGDAEAPIIHLGDLTDRGPDSRGVLDYLIAGAEAGEPWLFIQGNHDHLFLSYLENPGWHDPTIVSGKHWLNDRLGGDKTLESYGVSGADEFAPEATIDAARAAVPAEHIAFLKGFPRSLRRGDCYFVHAGIRPGVAFEDQDPNDLIWIREPFLMDTRDHGPLIVHGHTALEEAMHAGNRVNLDSGAGYGRPLTAAVFEDRDVFVLEDAGRRPLTP